MPSSYAIDDVVAKSVVIKTSDSVKLYVTVILTELGDSINLPPYMILN
jgi:hypothetical protein